MLSQLLNSYRKSSDKLGPLAGIALLFCSATLTVAGELCLGQANPEGVACAQSPAPALREPAERSLQLSDQSPASVAAAEESRVRAIIERFLESFTLPLPERSGFDIDRSYSVLREGPAYLVSVTKASWIKASARLDFGPLKFYIQLREGGLATVNFRLGDLITLQQDGQVFARLLIGHQENQGIWDDALENFVLISFRLGQLGLMINETPLNLTVDRVSLDQTLNRGGDDTWRQRQSLELTDLRLHLREHSLSIDRVFGHTSLAGREYGKWSSARHAMNDIPPGNDSEASRRFLSYLDSIETIFSRFDGNFVATDIIVSQAKGPLTTIQQVTVGGDSEEGKDGGPRLGFFIDLAGFQTQSAAPPSSLSPLSAHLEMSVADIPAKLFSKIMKIDLASEQIAEEKREDYLDKAFAALFLNSALKLYILDSFLVTPDTRLDLSAQAMINPKAVLGTTAELRLRVEGLEKLLDRFSILMDRLGARPLLAILVALSQQSQTDGRVVDSFDLILSEQGQFWLNGSDITTLFIPP